MNNECAKLMHCITLALALEACKTFQHRRKGGEKCEPLLWKKSM